MVLIFEAFTDSTILFKETHTGKMYVIGGQGCFAPLRTGSTIHNLKSWKNSPVFENETALFERCMNLNIRVATAKSRKTLSKGITLGPRWEKIRNGLCRVGVHSLLSASLLPNSDVFTLFNEEILPHLAIAYRTRQKGMEFRDYLKSQIIIEDVFPPLDDVSGAGFTIAKMNQPNISDDERKVLQEQLRVAHNSNKKHYRRGTAEFSRSQGAVDLRKRDALVNEGLRTLVSMVTESYKPSFSQSRSGHRQAEADAASTETEVDMANLDFDGLSIGGSCLICCYEDVVLSICLKPLSSTTDNLEYDTLQYPLTAGKSTVYRDVISSQNIWYQCALLSPNGRTIYQEPVKAIILVVKYEGKNMKHINKQFRLALAPGESLGDSEVAQIFMAILDGVLRSKSWAGADLDHSRTSADHDEEDIQT